MGFSLFDILSSFETGTGTNLRGAGVSKLIFSISLEGALVDNRVNNSIKLTLKNTLYSVPLYHILSYFKNKTKIVRDIQIIKKYVEITSSGEIKRNTGLELIHLELINKKKINMTIVQFKLFKLVKMT